MNRLKIVLVMGLFLSSPLIVNAQVDKRLQQKTSVQFEGKPVDDVLRELCEKHKLTMEFDPSVAANGYDKNPITLTADGPSLASIIHLVCHSANLISQFEKGKLLVTSPEGDAENLIPREYSLAALGAINSPQELSIGLMQVTSGHWKEVDGEGGEFVALTPRSVTIRQSRQVHAELQSLFDQIAAASTGRARVLSPQEKAEQMIVRKLQTPSQFPSGSIALPDFLDQLLKKNGVPYWIDAIALSDEGIKWKELSSEIGAKKMSPAARLDAVLSEHKLSWRVADEVVQITSATKTDEQFSVRVYDVSRAVSPDRPTIMLIEQLTTNKDLGEWIVNGDGGGGTMPLGNLLVIRQTSAVHAKLAKLLK